MTERRCLHSKPNLSLVGVSAPIATLLRRGLIQPPGVGSFQNGMQGYRIFFCGASIFRQSKSYFGISIYCDLYLVIYSATVHLPRLDHLPSGNDNLNYY